MNPVTVSRILMDHTFQIVALGTGLLGILSGVIGVYLTLRKQSLLGDVLGHASLPGIVIAFIVMGQRQLFGLLIGAALSGLLATAIINGMSGRYSVVKQDSALAIVLSSFFGLGTALLTYIQKIPNASQAGLDKFIFGQASGMLIGDVKLLSVTAVLMFFLVLYFWKEFKVLTFDFGFAKTLPGPYRLVEMILSVITVATIVLGLESVGAVLISALLVNPAIAARQWSNKLSVVIFLSGLFGFVSGVVGTFASSIGVRIPTGATIVLAATTITLLSLLFAPQRGLISRNRQRRQREQVLLEQLHKQGRVS